MQGAVLFSGPLPAWATESLPGCNDEGRDGVLVFSRAVVCAQALGSVPRTAWISFQGCLHLHIVGSLEPWPSLNHCPSEYSTCGQKVGQEAWKAQLEDGIALVPSTQFHF